MHSLSARYTTTLLIGFTVLTSVAPQVAGQIQPSTTGQPTKRAAPQPMLRIQDIALQDGSVLNGIVFGSAGDHQTEDQWVRQGGTTVDVLHQTEVVATAQTDKQGRFAVHGLNPGVYQLRCGSTCEVVRLWTTGTKPASARNDAMLVIDSLQHPAVGPDNQVGSAGQGVRPPGELINRPVSQPNCSARTAVFNPAKAILLGAAGLGLYHVLDHNPPGS